MRITEAKSRSLHTELTWRLSRKSSIPTNVHPSCNAADFWWLSWRLPPSRIPQSHSPLTATRRSVPVFVPPKPTLFSRSTKTTETKTSDQETFNFFIASIFITEMIDGSRGWTYIIESFVGSREVQVLDEKSRANAVTERILLNSFFLNFFCDFWLCFHSHVRFRCFFARLYYRWFHCWTRLRFRKSIYRCPFQEQGNGPELRRKSQTETSINWAVIITFQHNYTIRK